MPHHGHGQALVEFALVAPVMFALLLAVIEVGAFGARMVAWQQLVGSVAAASAPTSSLPGWWAAEALRAACGAPAANLTVGDPLRVTLACDYSPLAVAGLSWRVTVEAIAIAPEESPSTEP